MFEKCQACFRIINQKTGNIKEKKKLVPWADFFKICLLFAAQVKFVCVVIHATRVRVHFLCAGLVKTF